MSDSTATYARARLRVIAGIGSILFLRWSEAFFDNAYGIDQTASSVGTRLVSIAAPPTLTPT